jgi:hypothetical protein
VKLYNEGQQSQIDKGINRGLSEEQVSIYKKSEFDLFQMKLLRNCLENGMSNEQVKLIATPEFNLAKMELIKDCFQFHKKMNVDKMKKLIEKDLYPSTIKMITLMDEDERPQKYIELLENKDLLPEQISALYGVFGSHDDVLPLLFEKKDMYINSEYDEFKMSKIISYIEAGYDDELIDYLKDHSFNKEQKEMLVASVKENFTNEQIKIVMNPNSSENQMYRDIIKILHNVKDKELLHIIDKTGRIQELREIKLGLDHNLTKEQIIIYANSLMDSSEMSLVRKALQEKLPVEKIKEIKESSRSYLETRENLMTLRKRQIKQQKRTKNIER